MTTEIKPKMPAVPLVHTTYTEIDTVCRRIATQCLEEFKPDLILAIGGGGFIPARIMRTILTVPMLAISVSYYDSNNQPTAVPVATQWVNPAELQGKNVLIVDEVDDTRKTLTYVVSRILRECKKSSSSAATMPKLGIAVIHNKLKLKVENSIVMRGVYYVAGVTMEDRWIVYPWD